MAHHYREKKAIVAGYALHSQAGGLELQDQ